MRARALLLLAFVVLALAPLWLADWVVDDAAISYAYAENLVAGEGLVAVPGGERVEGYSNPLWVLLLASGAVFGADLFVFSKILATLCTLGAGWMAWRYERSALAVGFLAANGTFVIWNASGLENPLFTLLLLAGIVAGKESRYGLAGLAFGLLALTRPEALVYGLVAGAVWTANGAPMARYWAVLLGFFGAHEAFRIAYFAWPLPNTYYAKLGTPIERFSFGARGVRQLLRWAWESGAGLLLPLVWLGLRGRWMVGLLGVLPLLFGIYAGGDWMRGYRWMSLAAGPLALLLAGGVLKVHERWGNRVAWMVGGVAFGGLLPASAHLLLDFAEHPVDYPAMVERRVDYVDAIADRLHIPARDRAVLEMDMGAFLWHADVDVLDLAGLVDVPIARHTFADRAFLEQYVFEERRPLFAHVHRQWAQVSGLHGYPGWKDYIELPPYDDGGVPHGGVFLRRDALEHPWTGPRTEHDLGGLRLVGFDLYGRTVQGYLRVTLAFERLQGERKVQLEMAGQRWTVDPGHGVLPVARWRGTVVSTHVFAVSAPLGVHPVTLWVGDRSVQLGSVEVVDDLVPVTGRLLERLSGADCEANERTLDELVALRGPPQVARDGATRVAACWLRRGTLTAVIRARYWDRGVPGYEAAAGPLADARYQDGLEAMAQGDRARAYQAFSDVLALQPQRSWARRYAEANR